jgi:hypothetical protein
VKIIIENKIKELTPELMAVEFWEMDCKQQAEFFNHLDKISDFNFPFQLQSITDEDGLTLGGRRVMQSIGEYSHWGLVPRLSDNGKVW